LGLAQLRLFGARGADCFRAFMVGLDSEEPNRCLKFAP